MKVYVKCRNCKKEIKHSTSSSTRVEFAMKEGENKILNCNNCAKKEEYHVDDLYTKESKIAHIIAGLVLLIGTPLTFFIINPIFTGSRNHYVIYIVGSFLLVPVIVYGIISKEDQTRVSSFNRRKLKGRTHNIV